MLPSLQSTERFVGDLNPEAVIRERLDAPGDSPFRDRVGLWIESSTPTQHDAKSDKRQLSGTNTLSTLPQGSTLGNERVTSLLHQRYLSAMQACHPLPKSTREKLTTIFIAKIHPLIPILDIESLCKAQANTSASTFLERAICLVAAKDPSASSELILQEGGPILSCRQFCSELYKGLSTSMEAELEPDRLTRIRVLALMSLHCEGHEGAEAASFHLCQAIHQAQTIGLHLDRPGRTSTDPLARLFWCLWTLDKMHASIGGRPVLLADRDIGISKPDSRVEGARGAFAIWLAISELLATVISFYRPSSEATSGWEEGFPAFEDIVEEHTNGDVEFSTLGKFYFFFLLAAALYTVRSTWLINTWTLAGFLELYYHCVAILSCRYKLTENLDGTRISSIRQGLAAIRIYSIVAVECENNLPSHPIVPYAISLSMGVSYRQLRSSKLITHSNRAKASLEACCSLLEKMSSQWYSAEAMARLGRRALHQIEHGENPPQSESQNPPDLSQPQTTSRVAPDLGPVPSSFALPANTNASTFAPETINLESGMPSAAPGSGPGPEPEPEAATEAEAGAQISLDESLPMHDFEGPTHGFADIDMLFGEFLDLSLPTNFWDPVFAEEETS